MHICMVSAVTDLQHGPILVFNYDYIIICTILLGWKLCRFQETETVDHIMWSCPFAKRFWRGYWHTTIFLIILNYNEFGPLEDESG